MFAPKVQKSPPEMQKSCLAVDLVILFCSLREEFWEEMRGEEAQMMWPW
jgi:hypothetical protein